MQCLRHNLSRRHYLVGEAHEEDRGDECPLGGLEHLHKGRTGQGGAALM